MPDDSLLERLYEMDALPAIELPEELVRLHDGPLGFDEPCVYANFVASADGIVAIPSIPRSNDLIASDSAGDRFLMGLLRALADVVLIGAGVLGASPASTWRPDRVYPEAAAAFAELRRLHGKSESPEIAVLSGRGGVDVSHPLFEAGAVVLTSDAGAARLEGRLPAASAALALDESTRIDPRVVVDALRARGHRLILSEAGPHTFGRLADAGLVDELFLTVSPLLVGDDEEGAQRLRIVAGTDLVQTPPRARLLSVRRHESHMFMRYALGTQSTRTS
jgi:riboflavin biosynthesis pyrimidine reductase